MANKEWMTIPEYARHIGKSPQYIRKTRPEKLPADAWMENPAGKGYLIHVEKADIAYEANTAARHRPRNLDAFQKIKPKQKKKPTAEEQQEAIEAADLDPKQSLSESQRLKALYDAAIRKLDLEEREGKSIKKEDVEKDTFSMARLTRDSILSIPDRISAELVSITDVHVMSEKLTSELMSALEELSS